jgi:beta-N-acetylhexosaminidase
MPSYLRQSIEVILGSAMVAICLYFLIAKAIFTDQKNRVLKLPADKLRYYGQHFIVGYRDVETIRMLVSKGGIGGVYINRSNLDMAGARGLVHEIESLQTIQLSLGLPPLLIATDQEGGIVSRLSPPLAHQPPLAAVIAGCQSPAQLDERVARYAASQAQALFALGINLNLSPVVDLKNDRMDPLLNGKSSIYLRAISQDHRIVARVAATYCATMETHGIIPTLKHFPGLGSVRQETHIIAGELNQNIDYLEQHDWVPFRQVADQTQALIMLGHVKLNHIDAHTPASFSEKVVQTIIRQKWRHNGVLITDDLNMGPVINRSGGVGAAAVRALNAGIDLLLFADDPDRYFTAVAAIIRAHSQSRLNRRRIAASRVRLARLTKGLRSQNQLVYSLCKQELQ